MRTLRRWALIAAVVLPPAALGCGSAGAYRDPRLARGPAPLDPGVGRAAVAPGFEDESATAAEDGESGVFPRLSRGAVSDAEMLRNQPGAGYGDSLVPY